MKKQFLLFTIFCLLVTCAAAAADGQPIITDSAGNVFLSQGTIETVDRDLAWVGQSLTLGQASIANNFLGLGSALELVGTTVGADALWVAKDITVKDSQVDSNIFAGADTMILEAGSKAKAVFFAGNNVTIYGETDALSIFARNVVLNGTVHGDVHIFARDITVGDNAVIEGKLIVESGKEPTIGANAKIHIYSFHHEERANENFSTEDIIPVLNDEVVGNTPVKTDTTVSLSDEMKDSFVKNLPMSVIACVLMALVICWLAKSSLEPANLELGLHVIPDFFLGLLLLILLPLLALICIIFGFAVPLGIVIIAFLFAACAVSVPFFGAAVMRKCCPRMNRVLAAVIGAAVNGVLTVIPVIGAFLSAAACVWTLGHFTAFAIKGPKPAKETTEIVSDTNDYLETF